MMKYTMTNQSTSTTMRMQMHDDADANEEEEIANANDESEEGDPIDIDAQMDATYGLRARKPRDYGHIHTTFESIIFFSTAYARVSRCLGKPASTLSKKN
jgi:hypothetical protein